MSSIVLPLSSEGTGSAGALAAAGAGAGVEPAAGVVEGEGTAAKPPVLPATAVVDGAGAGVVVPGAAGFAPKRLGAAGAGLFEGRGQDGREGQAESG